MNLTSHQARLATSLLLVPLLLLVVVKGGWWVFWAILAVCLAGLWELYSMHWPGLSRPVMKLAGFAAAALILLAAKAGLPWVAVLVLLAAFWLENLDFLRAYSRGDAAYGQSSLLTAGLMYLPMTMQFILGFSSAEIFLVLLAAFLSDTGAYYAGTHFGRTRIWPRISPKKTWAGSVGGLGACVLVCLAMGLWLGRSPWWTWVALGAGLGVAAQVGDFFESALKRSLGVKDSSRLLPGHGGILDRIDALILVVLAYAAARSAHEFF